MPEAPEPVAATDPIAQSQWVQALRDPSCFPHPVAAVRLIETHISFVLLTGSYAYKIKKAVRFDFVDATTLALRKGHCDEELRLNRRLAPDLYLAVVAITLEPDGPRFDGPGPVCDYAVKMREFPQSAILGADPAHLTPAVAAQTAEVVAAFHAEVARAKPGEGFGDPAAIRADALANFSALRSVLGSHEERTRIEALERWTLEEFSRRAPLFAHRVDEGAVRECHGDLHLGNIALIDGRPMIFDGIDFNASLRWIDVLNEVAFLVMDLDAADRPDLTAWFLSDYLEATGDYAGLPVLRFYRVYRAMVRAKVAALRGAQSGIGADVRAEQQRAYERYRAAAERSAQSLHGAILLMHGFSGSGKSAVGQALVGRLGAVRVRSDVERKRLHGMDAGASSGAQTAEVYAPTSTAATYERLAGCAESGVAAGLPVLLDATFLSRAQRDPFRRLAHRLGVPFAIIDMAASPATLRRRIQERQRAGGDASEADLNVLEHQWRTAEPLGEDELAAVVRYDAEAPLASASDSRTWITLERLLARRRFEPT